MTHFTVQCAYAAYHSNTVTVEAETLAEALDKAIEEANQSSAWSPSDNSGETFVEAVAEGEDVNLWTDERVRPLPVPSRFAEDRGGPHIVITVKGGAIHHVDIENGTALVEVHDYDTEGMADGPYIHFDGDGTPHLRGIWSNRIEDQDPASTD